VAYGNNQAKLGNPMFTDLQKQIKKQKPMKIPTFFNMQGSFQFNPKVKDEEPPLTKKIDGKRFEFESARSKKTEARSRAQFMKMFWKHTRVIKHGPDYCVYVHGSKRK